MTETQEKMRLEMASRKSKPMDLTLLDGFNHMYHEEYNNDLNYLYKYYTKNGKKEGLYQRYHGNNNTQILKEEINYKKGNPHGLSTYYYDNGNIDSKTNHVNGVRDGIQIEYYKNGNLKHEINYNNGIIHGLSTYYYDNGNIASKTNYVNGTKDGIQINYDANGNIEHEVTYSKGIKEGVKKFYYKSGKLMYITNYKNNEQDGLHVSYYGSGVIMFFGYLCNGVEDGYISKYDETGRIIEEFITMGGCHKLPIKDVCKYYCNRFKEDLIKAVYHPDRIERMAKKYNMDCDDYLESI